MEVERDWLVDSVDLWLPKLSDQLFLACRTHPILVHSVPGTFDMSINSEDVAELINSNNKFIEHPSVIQSVQLLPCKRVQASNRGKCTLVIHFTDPTTVNCCIDCHVL